MKNSQSQIPTFFYNINSDLKKIKELAQNFIRRFEMMISEVGNENNKAILLFDSKQVANDFYKTVINQLSALSRVKMSSSSFSTTNYADSFTSNFGFPEEWHYGKLPHRNKTGLVQFITFRLADSLPQEVLKRIEEELENSTDEERDTQKRKKYQKFLDNGLGCCALAHPEMAQVMLNALKHHDGVRYNLLAWSIMPNHVHVLIKANSDLSRILQSWKSFTGKWALANNKRLSLGIESEAKEFWMSESWDRFIRDEDHFNNTIRYILENPKKANLSTDFEAYRFTGCTVGERLKLELQPAQVKMAIGLEGIEEFNDESSNFKVAILIAEDFSEWELLTPALIFKYDESY